MKKTSLYCVVKVISRKWREKRIQSVEQLFIVLLTDQ